MFVPIAMRFCPLIFYRVLVAAQAFFFIGKKPLHDSTEILYVLIFSEVQGSLRSHLCYTSHLVGQRLSAARVVSCKPSRVYHIPLAEILLDACDFIEGLSSHTSLPPRAAQGHR